MATRKKKSKKDEPKVIAPDPFEAPEELPGVPAEEKFDDTVVPVGEPIPVPSSEEMVEAGLIPDEDTAPGVVSKSADPEPPPSIEEIIRAGETLEDAQKIKRRLDEEYFIAQRKGRPFYRIRGVSQRGYWKIGRHFGLPETILFADELTDEEKLELDRTNPLHLDVERIGFDDAE